jgi:hypothetical protein
MQYEINIDSKDMNLGTHQKVCRKIETLIKFMFDNPHLYSVDNTSMLQVSNQNPIDPTIQYVPSLGCFLKVELACWPGRDTRR